VSEVSRALEVTIDRKVTQLREPMPYLAHFLFIKENMGKQTLESCWSSLFFLLSLSLSFSFSPSLHPTVYCSNGVEVSWWGFTLKCFANTSDAV
jgi:hypothetical protein